MVHERHLSHRVGWLRAAVLGANDGLVSTASLVVGVAAASSSRSAILVAGVASMAAGACSMAIGEYSSVSSQRDAEQADLAKERWELANEPEAEVHELAAIYRRRGLSTDLARQVAAELTEADALGAHARDELGLDPDALARPLQAAVVSAASFSVGAALPIATIALLGADLRVWATVAVTLIALAVLGAIGARLGGADPVRGAVRVTFGGGLAMAVTALVGQVVGTVV